MNLRKPMLGGCACCPPLGLSRRNLLGAAFGAALTRELVRLGYHHSGFHASMIARPGDAVAPDPRGNAGPLSSDAPCTSPLTLASFMRRRQVASRYGSERTTMVRCGTDALTSARISAACACCSPVHEWATTFQSAAFVIAPSFSCFSARHSSASSLLSNRPYPHVRVRRSPG